MKQHWHVKPLAPPNESSDRPDGFVGVALWALIVVGPMLHFGHELSAVETWLLGAYCSAKSLLLPIRDWL
ncbi:hypothetical protein QFZ88_005310 [Mesorhizobium sp. YL-MeA3-2017]|nr:hypothetical protein [Mesorhizobium sp. YL-MeA3-2017]